MTVGQIVLIAGCGIGLLFCLVYYGLKYGSNTNIETNKESQNSKTNERIACEVIAPPAPAAPVAPVAPSAPDVAACDVNSQLQLPKQPSYSEKEGVVTDRNEKQNFLMKKEKEAEKGESHPPPAFTN